MNHIKIEELQETDNINIDDYVVIETSEGTKKTKISTLKSLFNTKDNQFDNVLTVNNFLSSKTSPQAIKTPVTFMTEVNGENNNMIQYRYYRYLNGSYALLQDWSTNNSVEMVPNVAGVYDIWVEAKDDYNNIAAKNMLFKFQKQLIITDFTADKISPQEVGTKIKLTANATGTGTLKYKFLISDDNNEYYVIQDYSLSNTAIWHTSTVGTKTLYVYVQDENGNEVKQSMEYTLTNTFSIDSFIATPSSVDPNVTTDIIFKWTYSTEITTGITSITINDYIVPVTNTSYRLSMNTISNKLYTLKVVKDGVVYIKTITIGLKPKTYNFYYGTYGTTINDILNIASDTVKSLSKLTQTSRIMNINIPLKSVKEYVIFAIPTSLTDNLIIYLGDFAGGISTIKQLTIDDVEYNIMRSDYCYSNDKVNSVSLSIKN